MVEIINITHHPRIVLPEKVYLEEEQNAQQFLMELCDSCGVDWDLVAKHGILVDRERISKDTVVRTNSRIYILLIPIGG